METTFRLLQGKKDNCTWAILSKGITDEGICKLVNEFCGEIPESLNLLKLRYCILKNQTLFYIMVVLLIVIAFYLLGSIADTYLTPVLSKISKAMKLSETIAGVTLLAFANGAPDIIAGITAADLDKKGDADGVFIAAGGLFGACIFAGTIVLGYCIIKSSVEVKVSFLLLEIY